LGEVRVWLWTDEQVQAETGRPPKFSLEERQYLLEAVRFVSQVRVAAAGLPVPTVEAAGARVICAAAAADGHAELRSACQARGWDYRVFGPEDLAGFPVSVPDLEPGRAERKKVIVTGCYDWFHSGHVRFFEEASALGDLYVVLGSDRNVRFLKGDGHPLVGQDERRYLVQSIRHVERALISTGEGWMDAAPEIAWLRPDIYVVNEDGDKPEKRAFCAEHGLEYVVLRRLPRRGLPRRQSTDLRGY
jgi:cytidyltransferase-like protein